VVMGNDSNWGIDKTFQLAYFNRAVGTDLRFVRYDKVVEGIGGHAEYVEKAADVGPAVERAINSGLPSLVNVVVRPGASPLAEAMIARRTGH
jgi:acetolactate synthase I/II/III large subunit